jgi:hypothetical protein
MPSIRNCLPASRPTRAISEAQAGTVCPTSALTAESIAAAKPMAAITQPSITDTLSGTIENDVMASTAKRSILVNGSLLSPATRASRS